MTEQITATQIIPQYRITRAPPPLQVNYPQSVQSVHCLMRPQISNAVLFCENTQNGN